MDILTVINTFLIFGLIIYFFINRKSFGSNIQSGEEGKKGFYKFTSDFSEYEKKLIVKIHEKFFNKVSNNIVPLDLIYTTLWQESGTQIFNDVSNDRIIGDQGNSIGYFQIYKFGALLEVNQRERTNYKFEDLKNEDVNIFFGLKYLSYCLNSALTQQKNKPIAWLVAKKYNGGLDETENSINAQAETYANNYYSKFLKIKKFIDLNLG